jgi:transcriptional regulator with XRE-family HTH domain
MSIEPNHTDDTILAALAQRLARRRLDRGLTQAELAVQAGVSKRTVERMEAGASAQLVSLIRVLRTLGLVERLDVLVPEAAPSPMELLQLRGRRRQRAPKRGSAQAGDDAPGKHVADAAEDAGAAAPAADDEAAADRKVNERSARRGRGAWTWADDT